MSFITIHNKFKKGNKMPSFFEIVIMAGIIYGLYLLGKKYGWWVPVGLLVALTLISKLFR